MRERDDRGGHENDATHSGRAAARSGVRASEVDDPRIAASAISFNPGVIGTPLACHAGQIWVGRNGSSSLTRTPRHAEDVRPVRPPAFVCPSRFARTPSRAAAWSLRVPRFDPSPDASSRSPRPVTTRRTRRSAAILPPPRPSATLVSAASGMTDSRRLPHRRRPPFRRRLPGPQCHLWTQFGVHGFLGAFLAFQASRVRFRFSDTDLDVVFIEPGVDDSTAADADTDSSGDNKLQGGGANKWSFESVTNWEFWFLPPVYYKENQTRPRVSPLFPIIMDGKKLYEQMLEKMPTSVNPGRTRASGTWTPRSRPPRRGGKSRRASARLAEDAQGNEGFPGAGQVRIVSVEFVPGSGDAVRRVAPRDRNARARREGSEVKRK